MYDNHLLCFDEDTEEITNIFTDEVNYFGLHYDYHVRDMDMIGDYLYFNPRISEPKMVDVVRALNYTTYDEYDPLEAYVYGDRVRFHGGIFMANANVVAGETPATDTDLWDRVGDSYKDDTNIYGYDSEFRYAFNVIRQIPVYRPECVYGSDTDRSQNNLRGKMLRFAHRYKYFDNTYSKFGMYSDVTLPPFDEYYNGEIPDDITRNNYIGITVPLHSSSLIKEIDIIFQEIGHDWKRAKIVNRWEQELLDDTTYTYNFYNTNTAYEVIDDSLFAEVYDSVPPMAAAQELINKNTLTYAGCTEGFDPLDKDKIDVVLEPELVEFEALTEETVLIRDNVANGDITYEDSGYPLYETTAVSIDLTGCVADGVSVGDRYRVTINGVTEIYPIAAGDDASDDDLATAIVIFIGARYLDFDISAPGSAIVYIAKRDGYSAPGVAQSRFYEIGGASSELTKQTGLKTGAWHPYCLFYYDGALRRWDAQTSKEVETESGWAVNGTTVYVPMLNEYSPVPDGTNHKWNMLWEVYHRPPAGSKWWRWGYAGNSLASYFVQYVVEDVGAASGTEPANTVYLDITPLQTIQTTEEATWNQLPQSNISSYEWVKGDRIRIITEEDDGDLGDLLEGVYDYEILKHDDTTQRIFISDDFGYAALNVGAGSLVEIYRPKNLEGVDNIPFYEFGPIMPVHEDDNGDLTHGGQTQDQDYDLGLPATGVFTNGDVYHILRTPSYPIDFTEGYFHESQWYSDFYDSDDWSRGRIGIETSFKRKTLNIIRYSDQYLQDTEINGLSTFGGDSYKEVTDIYGDIKAIIEVGTTLKVYMQKKSASISIGRQEWLDADGSPTLTASAVVLGAVRYPENNFGTEWLESVYKNNRYVYGFDIYNAVMWRDSANGLFPISGRYADAEGGSGDYKMSSWFKDKSRELLLSGIENVRVLTTWDERYKLLYVTFRDKVRIANNDTIVFHEPSNRWITFAELEQTPAEGWNEILELDYDILQGFEGGLGYYFDEDTRFAIFNIGGGLGTTPDIRVFADLQEMTLEALEPTIQIDSSPSMDLLSLTLEILEPTEIHISYTHLSESEFRWDASEYSAAHKEEATVSSSEAISTVTSLPVWLTATRNTGAILSVGSTIYNGWVLYLYPTSANTGAIRSGTFSITDLYGNVASISVTQEAVTSEPAVTVMVYPTETWTATGRTGSVVRGTTTLYYEFIPHGNSLLFGTAKVYRNGVLDASGMFTMKDGMLTATSITVTEAAYGDVYIVQLYQGAV